MNLTRKNGKKVGKKKVIKKGQGGGAGGGRGIKDKERNDYHMEKWDC